MNIMILQATDEHHAKIHNIGSSDQSKLKAQLRHTSARPQIKYTLLSHCHVCTNFLHTWSGIIGA
jgi:hypothetical protein